MSKYVTGMLDQVKPGNTIYVNFGPLCINDPSITSTPLGKHWLGHVPSAVGSRECQMSSVSEQPRTNGSQATWLSSAEYLSTSLALALAISKMSSGIQPVPIVLHIIQHLNFDAKLFTEQVKPVQHCVAIARAIVKKNGNF